MGLIEDVKKLGPKNYLAVISLFSAGLAPGLLIIFYFKRDLFLSINNVKLLLLSTSLSLPQLVSSAIFYSQHIEKIQKLNPNYKPAETTQNVLIICFIAFAILYLPLLFSYFYCHTFKVYLLEVVGLNLFFYFNVWFNSIKARKDLKKIPVNGS